MVRWLCDRFGPRLTDTWLLLLGLLFVMEIALAHRFFSDERESSVEVTARHRLNETAIDPTRAVA
jgi:hypothetical protein